MTMSDDRNEVWKNSDRIDTLEEKVRQLEDLVSAIGLEGGDE